MSHVITTEDKQISFSRWVETAIKIEIINDDETVIDELISIINPGTLTLDGSSYVRRAYNFTMSPISSMNISDRYKLWTNKQAKLHIGLKTPRMDDYKWYPCGVFIFSEVSNSYDSQSNVLSVTCTDRMAQLDGTQNGELGDLKTTIPISSKVGETTVYNTISGVIRDTVKQLGGVSKYMVEEIGEYYGTEKNENYQAYRTAHPDWNRVPYDVEVSVGSSVKDILTQFIEMYPNNDMYFDEEGVFIAKQIPSRATDNVVLTNDEIQSVLVSESSSTNLLEVRNIFHIWGRTFEVDRYTENCTDVSGVYNVAISDYSAYQNGDEIGILIPSTNGATQRLKINTLETIGIYDEDTDTYISPNKLNSNTCYVFKIRTKYESGSLVTKAYLLGQWQAHALCALVDGNVSTEAYICSDGTTTTKYSEKYFQDKYGVNTVKLKVIENSPFTVQRIGNRLSPKSGDEFDNITSDSLCLARAEYELYKSALLKDSVTVTLNAVMPWMSDNVKVLYIKKNDTELKEYIVKKVELNIESGTTTLEMFTFQPLYE